jgi:hypothetical protein
MKQWFPFTDYDFYAYLTSGMLLIARPTSPSQARS